jgi:SNF2 family DNA or RNA helicase
MDNHLYESGEPCRPHLSWWASPSCCPNAALITDTMYRSDNKDKKDNPEKFAQDQELTRWAYQDTYRDRCGQLTANRTHDMDKQLCGKWPILRDLLDTWKKNGDKVLLFSRSTRLLDALQWWIETCTSA